MTGVTITRVQKKKPEKKRKEQTLVVQAPAGSAFVLKAPKHCAPPAPGPLFKALQAVEEHCDAYVGEAMAVGDAEKAQQRPFIRRPPPCVFLPFLRRRRADDGMFVVEQAQRKLKSLHRNINDLPYTLNNAFKTCRGEEDDSNEVWEIQQSPTRTTDEDSESTLSVEDTEPGVFLDTQEESEPDSEVIYVNRSSTPPSRGQLSNVSKVVKVSAAPGASRRTRSSVPQKEGLSSSQSIYHHHHHHHHYSHAEEGDRPMTHIVTHNAAPAVTAPATTHPVAYRVVKTTSPSENTLAFDVSRYSNGIELTQPSPAPSYTQTLAKPLENFASYPQYPFVAQTAGPVAQHPMLRGLLDRQQHYAARETKASQLPPQTSANYSVPTVEAYPVTVATTVRATPPELLPQKDVCLGTPLTAVNGWPTAPSGVRTAADTQPHYYSFPPSGPTEPGLPGNYESKDSVAYQSPEELNVNRNVGEEKQTFAVQPTKPQLDKPAYQQEAPYVFAVQPPQTGVPLTDFQPKPVHPGSNTYISGAPGMPVPVAQPSYNNYLISPVTHTQYAPLSTTQPLLFPTTVYSESKQPPVVTHIVQQQEAPAQRSTKTSTPYIVVQDDSAPYCASTGHRVSVTRTDQPLSSYAVVEQEHTRQPTVVYAKSGQTEPERVTRVERKSRARRRSSSSPIVVEQLNDVARKATDYVVSRRSKPSHTSNRISVTVVNPRDQPLKGSRRHRAESLSKPKKQSTYCHAVAIPQKNIVPRKWEIIGPF